MALDLAPGLLSKPCFERPRKRRLRSTSRTNYDRVINKINDSSRSRHNDSLDLNQRGRSSIENMTHAQMLTASDFGKLLDAFDLPFEPGSILVKEHKDIVDRTRLRLDDIDAIGSNANA